MCWQAGDFGKKARFWWFAGGDAKLVAGQSLSTSWHIGMKAGQLPGCLVIEDGGGWRQTSLQTGQLAKGPAGQ